MNVEQRLIEVFQTSVDVEPTPDLFSRVVHSIEEDRRHRRRVVATVAGTLTLLLGLVVGGAVAMQHDPWRSQGFVHRPTMEVLEWVASLSILLMLGPAIRRFGRGYAADLWPPLSTMPSALLRLMDIGYYLIGAGYVLLTAEFDFANVITADRLPDQLAGASVRIGGLVLLLGLLHATTLFVLPCVALVDNSTRRGRPLPRWLVLLLVALALAAGFAIQLAVGVGMAGQ